MKLAVRAKALGKKLTLMTTAFVLAVSSLTALTPFVLAQNASAVSSTVCATGCTFTTIQAAINDPATVAGDVVTVGAGDYIEAVSITKPISIVGAGSASTRIVAPNANATPVTFSTSGARLSGVTVTHDYTSAELLAWNFNNNGVVFNGNGNTLENSTVSKNRNGIYINNRQGNVITGNSIVDNRTGINLTNNVNNTTITGNTVTANWTLGMVYYYQSSMPTNFDTVTVTGNTFSNWYSEVVVKDAGASTGTLDVESNTFTDNPITLSTSTSASLNEPSFAAQQPIHLGGTATQPTTAYPTLRIYNSAGVTLSYDATPPATTVTAGAVALPANTYTDATVYVPASVSTAFQVQLADAVSGPQGAYIELFKANWNGTYGTWVKDNTSGAGNVRYGASPKLVYNTSALSGKYGLKVVSRDNAGNAKTTYHFFTIDRDVPTISIKAGASTTQGSSATDPYTWISFKLHDVSGNLKEVSLNGHIYNRGGAWNDLNWLNINPAHVLQGLNTITVRDKAGNESSLTFNYDTVAPVATITSPADGAFVRGVVPVSGAVTDDNPMNTHFKVTGPDGYKKESTYKDGRTTHSFNWDTTALTEGVYTIQFETRDKANNKTAVSVTSIDVTVDNTAPQLTVDAPVDLVTYGNSLTVTGSVFDDNLKEYKYQILDENKQNTLGSIGWSRLGGTSNATGDLFTADISNLADGTYYISVWATDKAGNATNTSGNRLEAPYIMKFTVDRAVNVSIDTIASNTATPTIQGQMTRNADGSSVANTDVVVTVDGTSYTTTTDTDGKWSIQPTVGAGAHTVTVALAGGASLASTSFTTVFAPVDVDEEEEEETSNPAGRTPLQTPAAATPLIVNPAGQAALGVNDDADDNGTPAVEGTSTEKNLAAAVNNTDGSAFGLAWYWWLLIVAGLATILWWIIAAARRRQAEN